MLTFTVARIDAQHQGKHDAKGKQRFKTRSTASNFQSGFLLHSKRKQIQKKKHLNPASKNYRILSCFCCCLLCGCVAFWSRLSRLLCVALRDLLNARGFFNHSIAFDFADVFCLLLFGVVSLSHICEHFNSGTELSVSQIANFGLSSVVFLFALF